MFTYPSKINLVKPKNFDVTKLRVEEEEGPIGVTKKGTVKYYKVLYEGEPFHLLTPKHTIISNDVETITSQKGVLQIGLIPENYEQHDKFIKMIESCDNKLNCMDSMFTTDEDEDEDENYAQYIFMNLNINRQSSSEPWIVQVYPEYSQKEPIKGPLESNISVNDEVQCLIELSAIKKTIKHSYLVWNCWMIKNYNVTKMNQISENEFPTDMTELSVVSNPPKADADADAEKVNDPNVKIVKTDSSSIWKNSIVWEKRP